MAYFFVHSFAMSVYFDLSVLNVLAISGTSGSSGLGSHKREHMDRSTKMKERACDKSNTYTKILLASH